jgi:DNA-binding SARP family transcriptional activator
MGAASRVGVIAPSMARQPWRAYDRPVLHIRLLGELEAEVGTRLVAAPTSRRAWALLGWLSLHPGDHPRGAVAARFWPDVLDASARASLRSAIWNLRRALGPDGDDALRTTRDRVGLRCTTDLQAFERHLRDGDAEAAVALCSGPLLADFDDEWVLEPRDRHAEQLAAALTQLADGAPTPAAAVPYARQRLALDPLDEAAARDLMARLAEAGDRAGAFSVYDRLCERLRTQLGIAPAGATREAADRLRAGPSAVASAQAPAPAPAPAIAAGGWPLVGRDDELAALVTAATAPGGLLAVMTGEAGIGKTRLARVLLERLRGDGARVAACAAPELGGPAPFSLWAELLRDLADDLPPPAPEASWPEDLAAIAPSLPRRLGRTSGRAPPPIVPELARARLFEAAIDLVEHACADRPLVLLFEDVHHADAASIELLAYVVRRGAGLPVLVVLTRRQTPPRPDVDALVEHHRGQGGALVETELAPLPREAVDRLVRSVSTLDADARDQVVAAADGNPLLAVESARAAAHGHAGPPPSLQAVVRAALGRLDPGPRRAAELAAVAGRHLTRRELAALTTLDDVLGALDSGLFAPEEEGFGFRHALLREAAGAHLPAARRRGRHEELAGALEGSAAETARHLRLAGRDEEAAERLAGAGADAIAVGAVGEAIAFLTEAVELRPADPALLLALAQAHAYNGDHDAAQVALDGALGALPVHDHAARARAHVGAAKWYSSALCHPQRTATEAHAALDDLAVVEEPDREVLGTALALGAWGAAVTGSTEDADRLLARLDELGPWGPELQYEIANANAFRALRDDDPEGALAHFSGTVAVLHPAPDRAYSAWANMSCIAAVLGRLDEALHYAESADVLDLPPLLTPLCAIRASLLMRLGRTEDARDALIAERAAAMRSGLQRLVALVDHDEGQFALAAGEYDRAADLLALALDGDAGVSRPLARLARAEALARLGAADGAEAELRRVTLEPVRPVDRPSVLVARLTHVQGLIALERGDEALAVRRLREAAAVWRGGAAARSSGQDLLDNLVDLGRPTIGAIEPGRELARVEDELARLQALPT